MVGKRVVDPRGNLVFLVRQMPVDTRCTLVAEGDIGGQARQVFETLKTVLARPSCGRGVPIRYHRAPTG